MIDFKSKPIFLAPMAGVTDVGFRAVCSCFGADGTVTEMLSARAMKHNPKKTEYLTLTTDEEKYKIAQVFGHEPEFLADAIQNPLLEKFDSFDINMGCPAPKIVKNGEGSALMDNPILASKIISTVKNNTTKPVSVKFRKGKSQENFLEFARVCEEAGADFVTFHARTVAQGYSGHADYEAIASVKAKLHIPVIGNGDVVDKASLQEMLSTGVDGVMVGRGSCGSPWIFSELKNLPIEVKKIDVVKCHIEILRQHFDENWLVLYMRKHLLWYAKDLTNSSNIRLQLATCDNLCKAVELLERSFNEN
ncbi:MAG: tRNA dihydrouridine synthase [Candidatus Caccovivens sp.]